MSSVYFRPSSEFLAKANEVFEQQRIKLNKFMPFADIQHIGSTSIPNSVTKGDLDIVIRIPKDKFSESVELLKSIYEINQPENWKTTFASFKDETNLGIDFGAQLVIIDSELDDFTKLRDILINNSKLVEEYNSMKLKYEGKDMDKYRIAKSDFFQKLREVK